jgi:hypothetical protein
LLLRLPGSVKQTDRVGFNGTALAVLAGHENRTAAHGKSVAVSPFIRAAVVEAGPIFGKVKPTKDCRARTPIVILRTSFGAPLTKSVICPI